MMNCYSVCAIIYIIGLVICKFSDLSKSWVKYFLLLWIVSFVTVLNVFLSFHATITCLLAIVYTTMYSSKRMMFYTCILTMCSVIISVYACRYYGVVDENMLLLSKLDLAVYFILPRCMICAAFSVVCSRVSKIINLNVKYAQKMENQAEIDNQRRQRQRTVLQCFQIRENADGEKASEQCRRQKTGKRNIQVARSDQRRNQCADHCGCGKAAVEQLQLGKRFTAAVGGLQTDGIDAAHQNGKHQKQNGFHGKCPFLDCR